MVEGFVIFIWILFFNHSTAFIIEIFKIVFPPTSAPFPPVSIKLLGNIYYTLCTFVHYSCQVEETYSKLLSKLAKNVANSSHVG